MEITSLLNKLRSPQRQLRLLLAFAVLFFFMGYLSDKQKVFWDFAAYYQAAVDCYNGGNPYYGVVLPGTSAVDAIPMALAFPYPPPFLLVFSLFIVFPFNISLLLYFAAMFVALFFAFKYALLLFGAESENDGPFLFAIISWGMFSLGRSVFAMNTAIFELALLWSGVALLSKQKPLVGFSLLWLAVFLKLTPLVFILAILMCDSERLYSNIKINALLGSVFLIVFLVTGMMVPELLSGYIHRLTSLTQGQDWFDYATKRLFNLLMPQHQSVATILYLCWMFFVALVLLKFRSKGEIAQSYLLAFLVYALMAPRLKDYALFQIAPMIMLLKDAPLLLQLGNVTLPLVLAFCPADTWAGPAVFVSLMFTNYIWYLKKTAE